VLIFLPPSEGKTPPNDDDAPALDLERLSLPTLAEQRRQVLEALIRASANDDAQQILKVGATVMPEVRENTRLRNAPTAPAHEIYTGVLFDALNAGTLDPAALDDPSRQVLVFSGLFGVTSLTDLIPAYRLSMGVTLSVPGQGQGPGAASASSGPGRLGSFWKAALQEPLDDLVGDQLVVDCRSSSYVQAYRAAPEQTLMVNNFTERNGQLKTVTHFAKHARGLLASMLLRAPAGTESVLSIADVAEIASQRWRVELRPAGPRSPHQLDLID